MYFDDPYFIDDYLCICLFTFIAPPDDIHESLFYENNIISNANISTSASIGLHFYRIWKTASVMRKMHP